MKLKEYELGNYGIDYIKEVLNLDTKLCLFLKKYLCFSMGNSFTYLPSDICKKQLLNFSSGGLIKQHQKSTYNEKYTFVEINNTSENLIRYLKNKVNIGCVVVFDDFMSTSKFDIEYCKENGLRSIQFGDGLIHIVDKCNLSTLGTALNFSWLNWYMLCLVFSKEVQIFENITEELISDCVDEIIVNSYDGESYIIWKK